MSSRVVAPKATITTIMAVLLGAAVSSIHAQEAGIEVGPGQLFPTIGLSLGYDDNIALSHDNEISSTFYRVSPGLRYQTGSRRNTLDFQYTMELGEYTETDLDDYLDHRLKGGWSYRPGTRHDFDLVAAVEYGHDQRGQGLREFFDTPINREVDEYRRWSIDGVYGFGSDGARGHLELRAGLGDMEYRNNRDFTRIADHDSSYYGGRFYWRIAPKTSMFVDGQFSDFDFPFSNRDSDDTRFGLGLQWEATGKTTGRLLAGRADRDFDDPALSDFEGSFWEASIEWQPITRSSFELSTRRDVSFAYDTSNYLVSEEYGIAWRHQWPGRLVTALDYTHANQEFDPGIREDDVNSFGVSANYEWRRSVIFGLGWTYQDRDSNLLPFDYDRNQVLFTVELSK